jgi:hypothetical protein
MVPTFTGSTTFRVPVPVSFDLELAATKYFHALPEGRVPLAFNFNGSVFYRSEEDRLQVTLVPWSCTAEFRMPVAVWRELIDSVYPGTGWIAVRSETLEALLRRKAELGLPSLDECVRGLLEERG